MVDAAEKYISCISAIFLLVHRHFDNKPRISEEILKYLIPGESMRVNHVRILSWIHLLHSLLDPRVKVAKLCVILKRRT